MPSGVYRRKPFSKKHRQNISKARLGITFLRRLNSEEANRRMRKPKSEKAKIHMKGHCGVYERTKKYGQIMSKAIQKYWDNKTKEERRERTRLATEASQKANPSSIEKLIWNELDELGLNYETQVSFAGGRFIIDIYIPIWKLIIECNGTYWHNYKIFPWKKIRDDLVEEYTTRQGYKIVWLWESEIRKNPKQALTDELKRKKLDFMLAS